MRLPRHPLLRKLDGHPRAICRAAAYASSHTLDTIPVDNASLEKFFDASLELEGVDSTVDHDESDMQLQFGAGVTSTAEQDDVGVSASGDSDAHAGPFRSGAGGAAGKRALSVNTNASRAGASSALSSSDAGTGRSPQVSALNSPSHAKTARHMQWEIKRRGRRGKVSSVHAFCSVFIEHVPTLPGLICCTDARVVPRPVPGSRHWYSCFSSRLISLMTPRPLIAPCVFYFDQCVRSGRVVLELLNNATL